jgi:putative transposase
LTALPVSLGKRNAQWYVCRLDQRVTVSPTIRSIFNASDANEATRLLGPAIKGCLSAHPKLAAWAEPNLAEGFTVFALPAKHRVRMRTTNWLERVNKEIKRKTRVGTLFSNTASCVRLVTAILADQDQEWMTAKIYLTMKP